MTRVSRTVRTSPLSRGALLLLSALATVALLAACTTGGGSTAKSAPEKNPASPSAPAAPSTPSTQSPIAGRFHECLQGQWDLDLEDYTAQSFAFVSAGSPLETLTITGTYTLGFSGNQVALGWDLVLSGVVYGFPFSMEDAYSGAGSWWAVGDTASSIEISDWLYHGEAPNSEIGGMDAPIAPMPFDPENAGPITIDCRGDSLLLSGHGGPLAPKFVRRTS